MTDEQLRVFESQQICCSDVESMLGDYVDNELTLSLRGRISTHIKSCKKCQESEQSYRKVIELAGSIGKSQQQELSLEIRNRLRAKLNEKLGINLPQAKA